MKVLLKSVKIVDKHHPSNGKTIDILIKGGKIEKIGKGLKADNSTKLIEEKGLCASKGWIDMQANLQDPGFEHKEDIQSGLRAAAAGGFTKVCVSALSEPVRDAKDQIQYLIKQSAQSPVELLPYASLSKQAKGDELSEFYDLKQAGAIGFSDDRRSVRNPNLLKNALLYSKSMDALVMNFPYQEDLSPKGVVNEGEQSTLLGLKGIPKLAEELMVKRDLYLQEYCGGRLHFSTLSSAKSIEMIADSKKQGASVSCDVASYQLLLSDKELDSYDTRYKTLPPLRSTQEIKAIIKMIKQGKIDALSSNHLPEDIDSKKKEFDLASFGVINLQTAVSAAITALDKQIEVEDVIALFTDGPARILGIDLPAIAEGETANLTLFDPEKEFTFTKEMVQSKSQNSPFFNRKLKGAVYGVIQGKQIRLAN
jgi:dihydroorotase